MSLTLHQRLLARAGARRTLRFDEYQDTVLYDPDEGYFAKSAERAGRAGDFLTSPEVAPLFADCLAEALVQDADAQGAESFDIIELGAGRGTLARDLSYALKDQPWADRLRFHLVEISPSARGAHGDTLAKLPSDSWRSYATLHDLPSERFEWGAVVANEYFDNLPVRRVMQTTRLHEILVRVRANSVREELAPAPIDLSAYLEAQGVRLVTGQTAEICLEAPHHLAQALARLRHGSALLIDYGDVAAQLYHADRFPQGTLAAHHGHQVVSDFYSRPGERDLTCHVNFTPLRTTLQQAGYSELYFGPQSRFLLQHGLPERLEARRAAARDELEKLRWTQWAKQLYHPEAMGDAFRVLHARRTEPRPGHRTPVRT